MQIDKGVVYVPYLFGGVVEYNGIVRRGYFTAVVCDPVIFVDIVSVGRNDGVTVYFDFTVQADGIVFAVDADYPAAGRFRGFRICQFRTGAACQKNAGRQRYKHVCFCSHCFLVLE